MEFKKELKPEVIVIKTEKKASIIVPATAAAAVKKEKPTKPQATAKENIVPAATDVKNKNKKQTADVKPEVIVIKTKKKQTADVKEKKQTKPQAPIKRKTASASNNKKNASTKAKKKKMLTKCCGKETCEWGGEVADTKALMTDKYGRTAIETCNPSNGRRRQHFHCEFAKLAGTQKKYAPNCATMAARTIFPDED
jgi:hypothetical protein